MRIRKKIFDIIEVADESNSLSGIYDVFMMITIIASIIPLAFKTTNTAFDIIDKVTVVVFIIDYVLRLITADYKLEKGLKSFVLYPFTIMAIIDILAILPSLTVVNSGLRLLKVIRLLRTLRVFRVFKAVRYSSNIQMILGVFKKTKESLLVVCGIAVIYTLVSALVIFNVEPDTFNNFFDAVYWATVSLTTMGYGDIYPVSVAGRIVTMISSFMGIAIVALPAGIITSGMMDEINRQKLADKSHHDKVTDDGISSFENEKESLKELYEADPDPKEYVLIPRNNFIEIVTNTVEKEKYLHQVIDAALYSDYPSDEAK